MQPPAPVRPAEPIFRAVYDFAGQTASELSFQKGEILEITKKEGNGLDLIFGVPNILGWWLAKRNGVEGWVPQNYLKEEIPAVTIAPPAPPPAPALRPAPTATGRISPAINKPTINNLAKGPSIPSAPKPPAANGIISF
jgi:myosin I